MSLLWCKRAQPHLRARGAPRRPDRQGPGPSRLPRHPRRRAGGRRPAAPHPASRRGADDLADDGELRLAAARTVGHDPLRRSTRHHRRADRPRRGASATPARCGTSRRSRSTSRPVCPIPTCCPSSRPCSPACPAARPRRATSTTPCSAGCVTCWPGTGRMPPTTSSSSTGRWMPSTSSAAPCCVPATPSSSRVPASRPCSTSSRTAGVEMVGVPLTETGLDLDCRRVRPGPPPGGDLPPAARAEPHRGLPDADARPPPRRTAAGSRTCIIVEDDSSGPISSSAPISLGPWLPEQVLHIRSYSKSHGPDLRLAAVSGPDSPALARAPRAGAGPGLVQPPAPAGARGPARGPGRRASRWPGRGPSTPVGATSSSVGCASSASRCPAPTGSTSGCRCATSPPPCCALRARASP